MQTSRRELLDDFLDFVGEQNDSNARSSATRVLNRAIHAIWMRHPWRQFEMGDAFEFPTVAAQRSYALPAHFGRVRGGAVRNLTTGTPLRGVDLTDLQQIDPDQGTSLEVPGRPELYAVGGTCGVGVLLPAPEQLVVLSSDAADTNVRATIEGYDANQRWLRQTINLNGTFPIFVPIAVVPWTFGKSFTAGQTAPTELTSSRGAVTLSGQVSGELQTLQAYESAVEHQILMLYPWPDRAGDTIAVPFSRAPVRTLFDGDPVPMHWEEAIFEEMTIQWRVNTGEMPADSVNVLRPKYLDLLAFDNANRFGVRKAIRPFTG